MEKILHGTSRVASTALLLLGLNIAVALAQLPTGTILGTVKDATGAVVPDSTVTVRNVETGLTRTQKSETNGSYRLVALPAGTYEVRAEQMGFRTEVRSNVGLAVGQEAVLNFALQVGAIEQTVEVTGEAPLVNTTSGSLGTLVNSRQVSDLPLNGRNYIDLTLLQPGVVQQRASQVNLQGAGTWMSINGAPIRSNFFVLDGAPIANYTDATTASIGSNTLGVEGIREWRVVTNAYGAEYGMRMGGQMTIVSKGGTNSFHGSLFEYLRNNVLDARNFFDYKTDAFSGRLPGFRRNQFGGSFGGPIKKDKLFFFGTYEALRERLGETIITNTIGAGCHGGAGATITNVACPQLGATASATIAPFIAPLLALYPDPNLSGNRVTFPASQSTNEHYGMVRGDYNFSDSDNAFIRYTVDDGFINSPTSATSGTVAAYPQFTRYGLSRSSFVTASESHTFGAAMVGTFRYSFSMPSIGVDAITTVPISPVYSFVPGWAIGPLSIAGITTLGTDSQTPAKSHTQNVHSYSGDLFYTKGRHSLKFGTLVNHYAPAELEQGAGTRGAISFNSLANFFRGVTTSYNAKTPGSIRNRYYYFTTLGFYLQDDLRVLSNLTLNLGLRYEFHTQFEDGRGYNSSLRDVRRDDAFTLGPAFLNPSRKNISPRFGFAWDVKGNGKTAVRGGFAVLYDVGAWSAALNTAISSQQPFTSSSSVTSVQYSQYSTLTSLPLVFPPETFAKTASTMEYRPDNPHLLTYSFTVDRQLPYDMALSLGYVGSRGINLIANRGQNPRLQTVRSDGRFFWAGNEPRINPNWEGIAMQGMTALSSWYNALQTTVTKRLSKGLQFQNSYTFGKLIDQHGGVTAPDNGGSPNGIATPLLPLKLDQGRSDFTVAQAWRFNAIYRLPEMSGWKGIRGILLNGWWVSGIWSAQSGLPFTVTTGGTDRSRSLGAGNLPDLNVGRRNSNIVLGTTAGCAGVAPGQRLGGPELYYDPCAFTLEDNGFLGTEGRNILTGPGVASLDFSLVKDSHLPFLGEGGSVQFRVEVFNILNHANFSRPSTVVFSAPNTTALSAPNTPPLDTAAKVTATDGKSRQIQLALKVVW